VKCYLQAAVVFILTRALVRIRKIAGKTSEPIWKFGEDNGILQLVGNVQQFPGSQASILDTVSTELTRLHAHAVCSLKNLFQEKCDLWSKEICAAEILKIVIVNYKILV